MVELNFKILNMDYVEFDMLNQNPIVARSYFYVFIAN